MSEINKPVHWEVHQKGDSFSIRKMLSIALVPGSLILDLERNPVDLYRAGDTPRQTHMREEFYGTMAGLFETTRLVSYYRIGESLVSWFSS
jgi:predicted metal-dependent hydrolase